VMEPWRLLDDREPRDGTWNMALDGALFQEAEEALTEAPVLRLYTWAPACLSIGFHQSREETCDAKHCRQAGYDIVRRPTGGKAVLHDDEVTYAVVARQDLPPFAGRGLMATYGLIAEALAAGLKFLGLDVMMSQRAVPIPPGGGAPCFLVPSEKEITVNGRKVVGSAQRRGKRAFLQHGSIPLTINYEALALASGQPVEHAAGYRKAFAGLADFRPGITRNELASAIAAGFRQTFPGPWEERPLSAAERAATSALISQPSTLNSQLSTLNSQLPSPNPHPKGRLPCSD
jgi:lipoyl(octanoyl) transferase